MFSQTWGPVGAAAGFVLLTSFEAHADVVSPELAQILKWIEERRLLISSWETQRQLQIALAVLTSLLGITIAVLQTVRRRRVRVLTVTFSATVVALTAIPNTVFEADHRQLRRASLQARSFLETCEALAALYEQSTPERREELLERIRDGLRSIDALGSSFTTSRADGSDGRSGGFFAVVHAAQASDNAPGWARSTPTSSEYFFFSGFGESTSLKSAEAAALGDAYGKSLHRASGALRTSRAKEPLTLAEQQALRTYVEKSSNVIDQRLEPTKTGTFKAWVLVQTRKSFLDAPAVNAFVRLPPTAPARSAPEAVGLKLMPLPQGSAASRESLRVSAARPDKGDFEFTFQFVRTPAGLSVRLDSIRVEEDGSSRGTKWTFDVFVNDRQVGSLPQRSYNTRPSPYVPAVIVETVLKSATKPVAIRVIGFRG
jgi:hypothetical protein